MRIEQLIIIHHAKDGLGKRNENVQLSSPGLFQRCSLLAVASNGLWNVLLDSFGKLLSCLLPSMGEAPVPHMSSSHILTIYKSRICPSLEYWSHVWGGAPNSTLCLLEKVRSRDVRLINNHNLAKSVESLFHRRFVADLSVFCKDSHGHCSYEIRDISPVPLMRFDNNRSSTHSHPFQVSLPNPRTLSHKSSFTPRTCNLWNVLPSSCFPKSSNLSSFKSKINKLDLISLSS